MSWQKRKEKQKQKLLPKAGQICLSVKAIFERNKPSTSSHTDLQNDLHVSPEIIQPEETSNYEYPDKVPSENNCEHIKNSKYPNVSFNGIPGKNQPKYKDFQETLFVKSSRSFSQFKI